MMANKNADTFTMSAASVTCRLSFPDLAPWLDNVSDDYDELPSGDCQVPYDE